jgi:hypothetical protein
MSHSSSGERHSVRPLLPPPADVPIPRVPRAPAYSAALGRSGLYGDASGVEIDSIRPLAVDTVSRPRARRRPTFAPWQVAAAVGFGGTALLGSFAWWEGRHGELVVDIADQQCGSLENVRVFVDDELRCTSAPCTLRLKVGGHLVRAEVDGYTSAAARAVFVDADVPSLHKIQTGVSDKTAIEVRGAAQGGQLFIDGSAEGLLPKRVTGLTRGEHVVQVRDAKGVVALERTVFLEEDQLLVLDLAVPLPPSRPAQAHDVAALPAEGAHQATSSLSDSSQAGLGAGSRGASPVDPGDMLAYAESNDSTRGRLERRGSESASSDVAAERPTSSKRGEASSSGTLKLTASPPSMVLLDGRPLGQTPQRIAVDPGPHTIIFVHPEHGRSRSSVSIGPGQTRKLHARF